MKAKRRTRVLEGREMKGCEEKNRFGMSAGTLRGREREVKKKEYSRMEEEIKGMMDKKKQRKNERIK